MSKKTETKPKIKTSFYLPQDVMAALQVIHDEERVTKVSQIEVGLSLYFQRHKKLLLSNGIDLWDKKR